MNMSFARQAARAGAYGQSTRFDRGDHVEPLSEIAAYASRARAVEGQLTGGSIRELGISDAPACLVFSSHLTWEDVRMRFGALRDFADYLLPRLDDDGDHLAFAAFDGATILGVLNLECLWSGTAELALIVRSDRQRRGIGRALLLHAMGWARDNGLAQVAGNVLPDNKAMLALARSVGIEAMRWGVDFIEFVHPVGPKGA